MKQERALPHAVITPKAEKSVRAGHPWIYDTEVISISGECENGGVIDVVSAKGAYLGTGFLSRSSKIRIRLLTRNASDCINGSFFARRVSYAVAYRRTVIGGDFSCCRLIFGEADGLPGVTVDRYGDILVTEILSVGSERVKDSIYSALRQEIGGIRGIYERNESPIRALEGLKQYKGWYGEPSEPYSEITENGIHYTVDVENGQKTGFFLDQKYNRRAVMSLSRGMKVLDCFTHTGSFALCAAAGGAEKVVAADVSGKAIADARANAERNGLSDRMDFVCADVFDLLPELIERRARFDMIILDPPAFTKSRKTVSGAERGYKEINYRAMRLLPRGGYLATCSCSHFMTEPLFFQTLKSAADDAGVSLRLAEFRHASPDHPILIGVPETDYLKFCIFQVI